MTVSGREQNIHECSVAAFYTRMCPAEYCCFLELQPLSLHQCFWMFHARLFVNSSTGGCLWEAPSVFRGNTSSASSLWLPPHPDSKENKPGLHHSDCTPARFFAGREGERCCSGPWWLQICWAGRACVVFLSFYSVWIWMTGGEAHSSVHCKSHYLLLQTPPLPATVYVTCRAPCPGRWNHRRKYMWRLNLLHVSRENTEENTILK